ncbi:MAG: ABC transporter permease [Beijerinckiaceae bacterium]
MTFLMDAMIRSVWNYRGFIIESIKREFQSKYSYSMLGAFWAFAQPVGMILIYTFIFSSIFKSRLPQIEHQFGYSFYICAGLLTWGLFSEIVTRGQSIFIESANIIKKVHFPIVCLPTIVVGTAFLNFFIVFGIFSVFLIGTGQFPGWKFLAIIPIVAIISAFAIGLGITLGVLNVFFRDVGQLFGLFLTFWFWLTPIVYPANILPEWGQAIVKLNPMTSLITACQAVLAYQIWPDWISILPSAGLAVLFCGLGFVLFRRFSADLVDEL